MRVVTNLMFQPSSTLTCYTRLLGEEQSVQDQLQKLGADLSTL